MLDHPGPFSEAHGGPKMAQNSTNMAQNITKMALHDPKCPYMTPNDPKTLPIGMLHDIMSCPPMSSFSWLKLRWWTQTPTADQLSRLMRATPESPVTCGEGTF